MILFGPISASSCPIFPPQFRISNSDSHGLILVVIRLFYSQDAYTVLLVHILHDPNASGSLRHGQYQSVDS
jgi:hypothetical protein